MTVVPFRRSPPPPPPPSGPKRPEPREATKPAVVAENVMRGDDVVSRYVWGRPACWSVWVLLGVQPLDQNATQ